MSPRINVALIRGYLQSFGRFQRNARLYLISSALSGVTLGIIQVLYNLYLTALGYRTDFIGLVLFVATIGAGLAIFPAGVCVDRFGGKRILIWASVLIALAGAGQMLFRTPIPLLLSTFLVGGGGAFILVVNAPFLTAHSSPAERPQLFSLNIVVTLATTVLGEFVGGILPHRLLAIPWLGESLSPSLAWLLVSNPLARSYQLALLLAGIIAAPSFIPLFLMGDDRPVSPAPLLTLPRLRFPFTRKSARNDPQSSSSPPDETAARFDMSILNILNITERRWISGLRTLLASPLLILVVVQILVGLGAGLFIPYFNIYFVRHLGTSSTLFGIIDGCANLLNALLLLLAPWLALRIGKVATMVVPRLLSIPVMLAIGLSGSLSLAAALYPLRQGLMDMSQGILQVFSMEVVPREHRGLANSSYQVAYQVAWACSAPLGGLIIERQGFAPVFLGASLLYTLAILLLWLRFRRGQYVELDEAPNVSEETANEGITSVS